MSEITRADVCAVACAEAFRGDGEIMASPMGPTASLGARLARATFEPDLLLTDGVSTILAGELLLGGDTTGAVAEGWMPYRQVFDTLWWGRRHVMMGATQIDRFGNQNIANIGAWEKPKVQLLGVRGAPGNTINHTTSYFIGNQTAKIFVEQVDMVSGIGYDRVATLPPASQQFHEIRVVVTNLGVYDFGGPEHRMRLVSRHPGVELDEIRDSTGFELVIPDDVPESRLPTPEEITILRRLDPKGVAQKEAVA